MKILRMRKAEINSYFSDDEKEYLFFYKIIEII